MTVVVRYSDLAVASAPKGFVQREMADRAMRPFVEADLHPTTIKMFRSPTTQETVVLVSDEPLDVLREAGWPVACAAE